jgi:ribosomal protein S18 acetylase RimI-like enzyme
MPTTPGPADVTLRRAGPADYDRVRTIYREASLSNEGDRPLLTAHPELLVFDPAVLDRNETHAAEVDGEIVGFVTIVVDGDHGEVDDLFVDPVWMRRGVASRLMTEAVAAAGAAGATTIEVDANGHALAFYERAGFVVDREVELEYGRGLRMRLAKGSGT